MGLLDLKLTTVQIYQSFVKCCGSRTYNCKPKTLYDYSDTFVHVYEFTHLLPYGYPNYHEN